MLACLLLTSLYHPFELLYSCRLLSGVEGRVITHCRSEIFSRTLPLTEEHITEAKPIINVALLGIAAHQQFLFVKRNGLLIFVEHKMTFGSHIVIYATFPGRIDFKPTHGVVKIAARLLIVSLMKITHSNVCPEARIQVILLVEPVEQQQCFMIFSPAK